MASVLYQAAKVCFQSKCKGFRKHYWSNNLNNLKQLSIASHQAWKEGGSPRNGVLNDNRLLCKKRYKCAIREAKRNAGKKVNDKLIKDLVTNDQKSFWKHWKVNFNQKVSSKRVIENLSDNRDISQGFGDYFKNNVINFSENIDLKNKFLDVYEKYCKTYNDNNAVENFLLDKYEVLAAILHLTEQKTPGIDKLYA